MVQILLLTVGGALAVFGLICTLIGVLYIFGGATVADPGPVLINYGLRRAAVGVVCLATGICFRVVASELQRR